MKTPSGQVSPSASNKDGSPQAKAHHVKRNSLFERNVYIEKIQKLYETHPEGPEKIADALIQQYLNQTYQEESLKSNYEELQNNVRILNEPKVFIFYRKRIKKLSCKPLKKN